MFSDPKYSFSVCPKKKFVLQSKVNIFHQIQPMYKSYINLCNMGVGSSISRQISISLPAATVQTRGTASKRNLEMLK